MKCYTIDKNGQNQINKLDMKWTWETKLQNYISYYTACCAPEVLCNVGQDKMDLCLILYFYISNELLILFSRQKNKNDLWSYMEAKGVLRIWWWLLFHVLPKMCNVLSFVLYCIKLEFLKTQLTNSILITLLCHTCLSFNQSSYNR